MINSSEKIFFHVFSREAAGTNSAKKLRKQGKVVGNIYGLKENSIGIFMDKLAVKRLYESQGDTGLIYLQLDDSKKQIPVLITEYETDVFGDKVLHVAFKRVNLNDPVKVDVPVYLVGEADIHDAVISLVKDSVEVEALPADLPEKFEIDISSLSQVGQSINLSDIKFDKDKVTLILSEDEDPAEITMVVVQEVKEEKAETEEAAVPEEEAVKDASDDESVDSDKK